MTTIRQATDADRDAVWTIFHEIVAAGETYPYDPATTRDDAMAIWFDPAVRTYVAERGGRVVGTYILKPNQPGLGSHVANAGYMVAAAERGAGVGRAMGEHSLAEARRLGYSAMQFNLVVTTNHPSVRLWQRLGFTTIGTLPGVFRHPSHGYTDAHVMFRKLDAD